MSALDPVSLERAVAWIDDATRCLGAEELSLDAAAGRVLGADLRAPGAIPAADYAAADGFAVRAEESLGAGAYNPLRLTAAAVQAGEPIPPAMDAVVALERAEPDGPDRVVVVEPIAAGADVHRRGAFAAAGSVLAMAGAGLTPRHLGMLAACGLTPIPVIRRPSVRLEIAGRLPPGRPVDSNGPMLRALIERDGGVVADTRLPDAFGAGADLIVISGGTGRGREDLSAAALAASGSLDIHGVALIPGESTGFGRTAHGTAVILLPGIPAACLWSYELFAGRAVRRLGGRHPGLPYRSSSVTAARKIVSAIGMTEVCPIRRLADRRVEPIASFAETGLMAAIGADGFVIVPAASEGYPAGAAVNAYFYEDR